MEHRYSARLAVDLTASVYQQGLIVAVGRIRNASNHGLYLTTEYSNINLLQHISIAVLLPSKAHKIRFYEVPAIVVRKINCGLELGLGLELASIDEQDKSIKALMTLVRKLQNANYTAELNLHSNPTANVWSEHKQIR